MPPPPPPRVKASDVHQTLEEAHSNTTQGQQDKQQQKRMRHNGLANLTDPTNTSGEDLTNILHKSGNGNSSSLQNQPFLIKL